MKVEIKENRQKQLYSSEGTRAMDATHLVTPMDTIFMSDDDGKVDMSNKDRSNNHLNCCNSKLTEEKAFESSKKRDVSTQETSSKVFNFDFSKKARRICHSKEEDKNNPLSLSISEEELFSDEEECNKSAFPMEESISNSSNKTFGNIHCYPEKDQLRMRAALNGHVVFSHHPTEFGEMFHVEWWYYLSSFDHTMIPFFKHSSDGDTNIVQIGNAIHCRDYQLKLLPKSQYCNDLSQFWSSYYLDNQSRILSHRAMRDATLDHLNLTQVHSDLSISSAKGGGHNNSLIKDEESSLFTFENTSQDDLINFDHLYWNAHKSNNEEPQVDDNDEDDKNFEEGFRADVSNDASPHHTFNLLSQMADFRTTLQQDSSPKVQDEDHNSVTTQETANDDQQAEIMLSLDQFIESSSHHINEQFKIISREFSRIFF